METPLQYIPKEPGGPMETPFKLNLNRVENGGLDFTISSCLYGAVLI
jgi:hypothetical protein